MLFLISALRAVVELIGLCLLGQGVLFLITPGSRARNPIYRFFELLTTPPRRLVRSILPSRVPGPIISLLTFLLIFFLWIGLAWMRSFV